MKTLDADQVDSSPARDQVRPEKKRYSRFELVEYGTVRTLTLGGQRTACDGSSTRDGNASDQLPCL